MGICIGIGNYIGNKKSFLTNKDPSNIYYNLITEQGVNILTELNNLILRDLNNLASETSLILISEDNRVIIKDDFIQPIASYRCYDKTNEDSDRDVLKDISGNGHDIQLYNFAFAESSGYGKYAYDFSKFSKYNLAEYEFTASKIYIQKRKLVTSNSLSEIYLNQDQNYKGTLTAPAVTLNIANPQNIDIFVDYLCDNTSTNKISLKEGINIIPSITFDVDTFENNKQIIFRFCINENPLTLEELNVTIEQIPDYQGALVSDGVDDYGLCENFPSLPIDKGFTVLAIRKWINQSPANTSVLLNQRSDSNIGSFTVDKINIGSTTQIHIQSYGKTTSFNDISLLNDYFIYCTSNYYNGNKISKGTDDIQTNILNLFCGVKGGNQTSSVALFALEIYDRDLTDEEIDKVKERMIAEYESKTGNKYEEVTA